MKKNRIIKKVCWCFFIIFVSALIITITINIAKSQNNSEHFEDKSNNSGEITNNSGKYDVSISEDEIDFTDENGNMISYIFTDDHLSGVLEVLIANNEDEASEIKKFYEEKIQDGEVERVVQQGNIISVKYDINYFEAYSSYTKDEIQTMLLKESNFEQGN